MLPFTATLNLVPPRDLILTLNSFQTAATIGTLLPNKPHCLNLNFQVWPCFVYSGRNRLRSAAPLPPKCERAAVFRDPVTHMTLAFVHQPQMMTVSPV